MNLEYAVKRAAEIAVENNGEQIVGKIPGSGWVIADWEDEGRKAEMRGTTFVVHGWGIDPEDEDEYLGLIEKGE